MRLAQSGVDPVQLIRGVESLRRQVALYPEGHTVIDQSAAALQALVDAALEGRQHFRVEILEDTAYAEGYPFRVASRANEELFRVLNALNVNCIDFERGATTREMVELARLLNETADRSDTPALRARLAERGVKHLNLTRLLPVNTDLDAYEWPELPEVILDAAYGDALARSRDAVGAVFEGEAADPAALRGVIDSLKHGVLASPAAMGQILAVKRYDNYTYCHSVNVASLSIMLARELALAEEAVDSMAEAALLHDVGKRQVPQEVLRKPGRLDAREWRMIERHPAVGGEILAQMSGLHPYTPLVALEHHRACGGGGYPDLGDRVPHFASQIVAVADTYEALTGARPYRDPMVPEEACLILARKAGQHLNPALVRAFVSMITFFPIGTVVRTSRDEVGVVLRVWRNDPLSPVIRLIDPDGMATGATIDLSERDTRGQPLRRVVETLPEALADLQRTGEAD